MVIPVGARDDGSPGPTDAELAMVRKIGCCDPFWQPHKYTYPVGTKRALLEPSAVTASRRGLWNSCAKGHRIPRPKRPAAAAIL